MGRVIVAVVAVFGASVMAAAPACADGPAVVVENPYDIAAAVGSGVQDGVIVGFSATGPDVPAAAAAVTAACRPPVLTSAPVTRSPTTGCAS